jgi:hypothetical protein
MRGPAQVTARKSAYEASRDRAMGCNQSRSLALALRPLRGEEAYGLVVSCHSDPLASMEGSKVFSSALSWPEQPLIGLLTIPIDEI